ncbi:MAG: hypothetical protein IMZ53_08480 [Thermoplasmata archaeon]|nr:hypothetical protein [Thermoplasmata archaeon]
MDYPELIKMQDKILSCARFDDIAPVAVYLHADLKFKKEAQRSIAGLKRRCKDIPQVQELKAKDVIDGNDDIGFDRLYNKAFEEILTRYHLETETYTDKYGAYCYRDKNGHSHCGDDSCFYPWYLDEETLKKQIESFEV